MVPDTRSPRPGPTMSRSSTPCSARASATARRSPCFDGATRRHRLIDVIARASQTGAADIGTPILGMSRHPSSMIARVRLRWLGEVLQMSAIGTEETIDQAGGLVGLL